jgi:hypothetical protein
MRFWKYYCLSGVVNFKGSENFDYMKLFVSVNIEKY